MYRESHYYAQYLLELYDKLKETYPSIYTFIISCLSHKSTENASDIDCLGKSEKDIIATMIQKEALSNCRANTFSSFICMIALSSVIKKPIISHYPDCGANMYKETFNTTINPRTSIKKVSSAIHILWCNTNTNPGSVSNKNWRPNHFVPLIQQISKIGAKRKISCLTQSKKDNISFKGQSKINFSKVYNTASNISLDKKSSNLDDISESLRAISSSSCNEIVDNDNIINNCDVNKNSTNSIVQKKISFVKAEKNEDSTVEVDDTDERSVTNFVEQSLETSEEPVLSEEKFDVATYYEKGQKLKTGKNDSDLKKLISNVWKPHEEYDFPTTVFPGEKNPRSFLNVWFKGYDWLAYSKLENGTYCLSCSLFGSSIPNSRAGSLKLVSRPFSNWKNAKRDFNNHQDSGLHKASTIIMSEVINRSVSKSLSINIQIDNVRRSIIEENRKKLYPIVKTILLCGRNDLPLRGHRDDSQYHPTIGEFSKSSGVGNFIELLNFRVDAGDKILEDHLKNAPANATYISKETQNELIVCCGEVIEDELKSEMKQANYFSVLADEATDCSNTEQMSIVIRFVDKDNEIREEFIRFVECKEGTTGLELAKNILNTLPDFELNIEKCRGQGYDGAASMSGKTKGVSSRIKEINPKAHFFHCDNHNLSLVVGKSCKIQQVRNVLEQLQEVTFFFENSPKRELCLSKHLGKGHNKLESPCQTRWVLRLKGLDTFFFEFAGILSTFEEMAINENKVFNVKTSSEASSYVRLLTSFQFIVVFVLTKQLMDYFFPITTILQAKDFDISKRCEQIENLKKTLKDIRGRIDIVHKMWYNIALELAKEVNVYEVMPRTCWAQFYRDNYPDEEATNYYRKSITIPLLDHMITELDERFDTSNLVVYNGLYAVPRNMVRNIKSKLPWKKKFLEFLEFYKSDLPHPTSIAAELDLWENFWKDKKELPLTVASLLKTDLRGFPNIHEAFLILGTLPITTCECERSVSAIRRLKTYTRSSMDQTRFNSLALMSIHRKINPDIDKIINTFASKGPRRLELLFANNTAQNYP